MKTEIKFKREDKVRIKGKDCFGHRKLWYVDWIFKNGDIRLRNAKNPEETIERYQAKELKKGWRL